MCKIEGSQATLLSRYVLSEKKYHDKKTNVSWEKSSVRSWLNKDFFNAAFSKKEQQIIVPTLLANDTSQCYKNGNGGPDTTDKVFLLSAKEVGLLVTKQDIRVTTYTDTAIQVMAKLDSVPFSLEKELINIWGGYGSWMLRSVGTYNQDSSFYGLEYVSPDSFGEKKATVESGTFQQYSAHEGIRPAIVIDLNGYPVQ